MNLLASDIRKAIENGRLSEAEGKEIAACTKYLIRYVMRSRDSKDQERMVHTMGGQVLDFLFDEELFKKKLEEMKSELNEKDSELKEKDSELKEKDSELKKKDSEIEELRAKLKVAGIPY